MDEPRWLDGSELTAWQDFLTAGALLNRLVEQQLRENGLSHPQYEVLVRLSEAGGELRMTELAEAAVTSKSGLSYQVAQLEKLGLVTRRSCPTDVRGVIAELTSAGWARLRAAAPGHAALVRTAFVEGLDPERFRGLAAGLAELADRLRSHE
ncbi:MarR family winged helix-turn-helix transcriptional regulator [Crossiella cryophila]|uniref:DNA-binding MarR family transcriptional regulator n=1 Tax=Crossiella cryophila TaxID=43355 RepID=A0A7W7CBG6_9PSEU|nr:MarR family transcriptional regulator [Crossiella cryophila]MBB4677957.1 DNA-binding MarR family transcriptional regulator [Crossiella cryophila]